MMVNYVELENAFYKMSYQRIGEVIFVTGIAKVSQGKLLKLLKAKFKEIFNRDINSDYNEVVGYSDGKRFLFCGSVSFEKCPCD